MKPQSITKAIFVQKEDFECRIFIFVPTYPPTNLITRPPGVPTYPPASPSGICPTRPKSSVAWPEHHQAHDPAHDPWLASPTQSATRIALKARPVPQIMMVRPLPYQPALAPSDLLWQVDHQGTCWLTVAHVWCPPFSEPLRSFSKSPSFPQNTVYISPTLSLIQNNSAFPPTP